MKIAICQLNTTVGDIWGNLEKVKASVMSAQAEGAKLAVLPELAISGYPPKDLLFLPDFISAHQLAVDHLIAFSTSLKLAMIIGAIQKNKKPTGMPLKNSALFIEKGQIRAVYDKMLLPNYDVFDEKRYFSPGKKPIVVTYEGLNIGLTICEDLWHEAEFFNRALYSVDPLEYSDIDTPQLIINISASPFSRNKTSLKHALYSDVACKKKAFVICCNLVGGNDELVFDGGSFLASPAGEINMLVAAFEEGIGYVEIGKEPKVSHLRTAPLSEENRVLNALVMGVKDYVQKSGLTKVILGLSGGIDSALVAAICASALGGKNVLGLLMPSQYSSQGSIDDSILLANNLSIQIRMINIQPLFASYRELFHQAFECDKEGVAYENIQARIRGNMVMGFANEKGYMAIATGNKSELATGYCTLYGDMCGGLAPIGDIPKLLVYKLAKFINTEREIIPQSILTKAPSAELKANQKDQDSLPAYEALDAALEICIEQKRPITEATSLLNGSAAIEFVSESVRLNEFKRRQAAPVLMMSTSSFGMGWRMPLVNKFTTFKKDQ